MPLNSKPLRVAFVGCGAMAQQHLTALRRLSRAIEIVGACDASPPTAAAFSARAGTQPFATLDALIAATRPDIVHICTPAGRHFEPARAALLGGAHVYIEKPMVETTSEAEELLAIARTNGLLVCAGHQLTQDPSFRRLLARRAELEPLSLVDSYFAFRPPRLNLRRASRRALAEQLLDVLPHPLYTLIAALDSSDSGTAPLHVTVNAATATEIHAFLRVGETAGRLCVSLRARPLASTLTLTGAHGSLTADFVRAIVLGAANEGTGPLEKILNPFLEAGQATWRTALGLSRRLLAGGSYPGLAELLGAFYDAAATGGTAPLAPEHLVRVTSVYESLAAQVRNSPEVLATRRTSAPERRAAEPIVVVTGANGFLGRELSRALTQRGYRVRGIGRSSDPGHDELAEWVRVDLGSDLSTDVFAGASAVVHAAAETAGGFEQHERNSVAATRNVLAAAARVPRLVYVSSISVLRPPRSPWERQDEQTPLPARAKIFGPYTWGKCAAEEEVARAGAGGAIATRIIRPAALFDWDDLELPGLVGKRLFGRWHLGFGRPSLPFAACDVRRAAAVIAWCVEHFDQAPPVLNLMDPDILTRGGLLAAFRARGWQGHFVWVPISAIVALFQTLTAGLALSRFRIPERRALWGVLRPRRYDMSLAARILTMVQDGATAEKPAGASARQESGVGIIGSQPASTKAVAGAAEPF